MQKFHPSYHSLLVFAMLLCVSSIHLWYAGAYFVNADEAGYIQMAHGKTFSEVLHFSRFEVHAPLGNILRHVWLQVSDTLVWVRTQTVLCGALCIWLMYRLGTLAHSRDVGIIATALFAYSSVQVEIVPVVRNYPMMMVFMLLSLIAYVRLWNEFNRKHMLAFAGWGVLAVLTSHVVVLLYAVIVVYELWVLRKHLLTERYRVVCWLIALALLGAAALWVNSQYVWTKLLYDADYAPESYLDMQLFTPLQVAALKIYNVIQRLVNVPASAIMPVLFSFLSVEQQQPIIAVLFFVILIVGNIFGRGSRWYVISAVLMATLCVFCYLGKYPFMLNRHLYFIMPPLVLMLALILQKALPSKTVLPVVAGYALVSSIVMAAFYLQNPNGLDHPVPMRGAEGFKAYVAEHIMSDDVLLLPKSYSFWYAQHYGKNIYSLLPDTMPQKNDFLKLQPNVRLYYASSGFNMKNSLRDVLLADENYFNTRKNIWFLSVSWPSEAMWKLYGCKGLEDQQQRYTVDGVAKQFMLFSIPAKTLMHDILPENGTLHSCL